MTGWEQYPTCLQRLRSNSRQEPTSGKSGAETPERFQKLDAAAAEAVMDVAAEEEETIEAVAVTEDEATVAGEVLLLME